MQREYEKKNKVDSVREQSLLWGVIAEIGLGGTILIMLNTSRAAARQLPMGRTGSISAIVAAAAVALLDLVLLILRADLVTLRRGLTLLTFVAAGVVTALAVISMSTDAAGPWILIALGAVGMFIVARGIFRPKGWADSSREESD